MSIWSQVTIQCFDLKTKFSSCSLSLQEQVELCTCCSCVCMLLICLLVCTIAGNIAKSDKVLLTNVSSKGKA